MSPASASAAGTLHARTDAAARHRRRALAGVDRARFARWQPRDLAITHFGVFDDAAAHLDAAERSLEASSARAREQGAEEWIAQTLGEIESGATRCF